MVFQKPRILLPVNLSFSVIWDSLLDSLHKTVCEFPYRPGLGVIYITASHWLEVSHMGLPNCKGSWEIALLCVYRKEIKLFDEHISFTVTLLNHKYPTALLLKTWNNFSIRKKAESVQQVKGFDMIYLPYPLSVYFLLLFLLFTLIQSQWLLWWSSNVPGTLPPEDFALAISSACKIFFFLLRYLYDFLSYLFWILAQISLSQWVHFNAPKLKLQLSTSELLIMLLCLIFLALITFNHTIYLFCLLLLSSYYNISSNRVGILFVVFLAVVSVPRVVPGI